MPFNAECKGGGPSRDGEQNGVGQKQLLPSSQNKSYILENPWT